MPDAVPPRAAVECVIEDARWDEAGLDALAVAAAGAVLARLGLDPENWEIAVLGCDDARIAALNEGFRGRAAATNVLSWPSGDRAPAAPGEMPPAPDPAAGPELGDIAIAFDTCAREAGAGGVPLRDHALHLLVHAGLHLLGYDHETDADATLMESLEVEILASLGLPDPYTRGAV